MKNNATLILRPARNEALASNETQRALSEFTATLNGNSRGHRVSYFTMDSVELGSSINLGEFAIEISKLATPIIAALGAYLAGRAGRKVRLKVGDIELEASSVEQLDTLIEKAKTLREPQSK